MNPYHDPTDSPEEQERRLEQAGDWETLQGRWTHPHACRDCVEMSKDGLIGWRQIREKWSSLGCYQHTRHPYTPEQYMPTPDLPEEDDL